MSKVISSSEFNNLTEELKQKYQPFGYKLKKGSTFHSNNQNMTTISVQKYNSSPRNIKNKYEIFAYLNISDAITLNKYLEDFAKSAKKSRKYILNSSLTRNKNDQTAKNNQSKLEKTTNNVSQSSNKVSNITICSDGSRNNSSFNNLITHAQYINLSPEMKELYEELKQSDIKKVPKEMITTIGANEFNKLRNQNKNSYIAYQSERVHIQEFKVFSYREKIYILKSYKKNLNNRESLESKQKNILSRRVIGESLYNYLNVKHKDEYIRIEIDRIPMYFRKDSLIITEDIFKYLWSKEKDYYEIITIEILKNGKIKNEQRYIPKNIRTRFLNRINGYKSLRHIQFLSEKDYKLILDYINLNNF